MESILHFVCENSHNAHWIIFILLLLAGINVPISEDFLLVTGGVIASTCFTDPTNYTTFKLFFWIFLGCWISAWEAYWVGRLLGPKLYEVRWFSRVITPHRIERLHHYYEKFGIFTFILGRFIPGGVRNALFMTSGLGKMPFRKFIIRDAFACTLSSVTIFSLGYLFGENYKFLFHLIRKYEIILISLIIIILASVIGFWFWKKETKKA
jgi:membrane-associated protein